MGALLTGCAGTDAQQDAGSGTVNTGSGEPAPCLALFFNDTATTEIYTLSLHDALPI